MGLPIHIKDATGRYRVRVGDLVLGETDAALIVDEAGHQPVIYVPRADMNMVMLTPTERTSTCPWKGKASYFSVAGLINVVWSYETPLEGVASIAGHLAFYPAVTVEAV